MTGKIVAKMKGKIIINNLEKYFIKVDLKTAATPDTKMQVITKDRKTVNVKDITECIQPSSETSLISQDGGLFSPR